MFCRLSGHLEELFDQVLDLALVHWGECICRRQQQRMLFCEPREASVQDDDVNTSICPLLEASAVHIAERMRLCLEASFSGPRMVSCERDSAFSTTPQVTGSNTQLMDR